MSDGVALALAAEQLINTPFRLHGRDPATGIDCVGLLVLALAAIGRTVPAPSGYGIRNSELGTALAFAPGMGLAETDDAVGTGDVILVEAGPLQHHLLIAAENSRFIHAHAGLGRVATTPGPLAWPILRHWRLAPLM